MAGTIRPHVIALLSDFGTEDPYVGCLKGAITKINPIAPVIDVCHALPPYNITSAAFILGAIYNDFPEKTIFVCVVDPGVGSGRPIIIATAGRNFFIAPDNGILTPVFSDPEFMHVYQATADHFFLPSPSKTFHGRDIMAPLAAWITKGIEVANMGECIDTYIRLELPKSKLVAGSILQGQIMHIDHFGNCITNISRQQIEVLKTNGKKFIRALANGREVQRCCDYYAQIPEGPEPACVVGSLGYIEVACNRASARQILAAEVGAEVGLVFE